MGMLLRLYAHSYSAIAPPKTPICLRSSLRVSLEVCMLMSFPESELGKL